jgi:hypothetical protein
MMRFARSRFAVMSVSVPCSAPLRLRYCTGIQYY